MSDYSRSGLAVLVVACAALGLESCAPTGSVGSETSNTAVTPEPFAYPKGTGSHEGLTVDVLEVRLTEVPLKTLTKIRMHAQGKPPARVWVWTYLVSPEKFPTASWAAIPVQIDEPFADGPTTTMTVESICYFCGIPFEPGTDFFARTMVSTVSNDDAYLRPEYRDRTKKGAIKVILGAESTNPFEPYIKNKGKMAYNKANGVVIGPIEDVGYADIPGEGTVIVYKIRYQGEIRDMPVDDVVAR